MNEQGLSFKSTRIGDVEFEWGRKTYIMGIINLSPDSFSGDGLGGDVQKALRQAKQFVEDGAHIIDVGGESTRPGTETVSIEDVDKELELVIPVIRGLSRELPVPVSIDTYKSKVAAEAVKAGASIVNDIWGLKKDSELAKVAAGAGVTIILSSNQRDAGVSDIMAEIISDLNKSISIALKAGVSRENIIVDPGIGFGKTLEQNLEIMHRLAELKTLGRPILVGTSRKSMIGLTLDLPPDQRLEGTAATVAIGIASGADIVRVHDVKEMVRVCRMSDAIVRR